MGPGSLCVLKFAFEYLSPFYLSKQNRRKTWETRTGFRLQGFLVPSARAVIVKMWGLEKVGQTRLLCDK